MTTDTTKEFAEASASTLETIESIGTSTLNNAERLASLNLETVRNGFQQMEGAVALMQAKNFQDFLALQNTLTKPVLQNAINYYSRAYAIASESQLELRRLAENGYAEFTKSVNSILEKATKESPVGNELAIATVKSVFDAANSAYNTINEAARTATEIAVGSVQASAQASNKAIDSIIGSECATPAKPGKKSA